MIDEAQVLSLYSQNYSMRQIADRLKIGRTTVQNIVSRAGMSRSISEGTHLIQSKDSETSRDVVKSDLDSKLEKLLRSARRKLSIEVLSDELDTAPKVVRAAIERLQSSGKNINVTDGFEISKDIVPSAPTVIDTSKFKGKHIKFGLTGDNHLGSKYCRLDVLNALFDIWEDQGIDTVYQLGNMIDGDARFNKFDLLAHGMEEQVNYFVKNWPKRKGIVTKFVTGDDHEGWYVQREGVDIGRVLQGHAREEGREDLVYLGHMEHDIILQAPHGQSTMRLIHAGGGSAYATSYSAQKIVESYSGGEKPSILLIGHYHKAEYGYPREVHVVQCGCFTANTHIQTPNGKVKIKHIKVGDIVTSPTGVPRRVTRTFCRPYSGQMVRINFGRKGRPDQTVTATTEHPILSMRGSERVWRAASELQVGDKVFTETTNCRICSAPIPYWLKMCNKCNSMDDPACRQKLSATRGGNSRTHLKNSDGQIHLERDIIPFCEQLREDGWQVVPVGAAVIPDAIGFKGGKVVAFELERARGEHLAFKKEKYEGSGIIRFVDEVRWINITERQKQSRANYEIDPITALAIVDVREVTLVPTRSNGVISVYNFEVEEENAYMAGHIAVHNCTEDQTPFMRKLKIQAHVGGWTISFDLDDQGLIHGFTPQFHPFYDRAFYEDGNRKQWGYKFGKTQPRRPTIIQ